MRITAPRKLVFALRAAAYARVGLLPPQTCHIRLYALLRSSYRLLDANSCFGQQRRRLGRRPLHATPLELVQIPSFMLQYPHRSLSPFPLSSYNIGNSFAELVLPIALGLLHGGDDIRESWELVWICPQHLRHTPQHWQPGEFLLGRRCRKGRTLYDTRRPTRLVHSPEAEISTEIVLLLQMQLLTAGDLQARLSHATGAPKARRDTTSTTTA